MIGSTAVEIVTTLAALDAMEREWNELFSASPVASPPLKWDWVREWWRVYGPIYGLDGRGLRIFAVRDHGRLIGVLPLYRRAFWGDEFLEPRRLLFLSQGEAVGDRVEGEYQDLLSLPGESDRCLTAIEAALFDGRAGSWDVLSLTYVAETSVLRPWVTGLAKRGVEVIVGEADQFPIANLSSGFEAFIESLSYKGRRNARAEVKAAAKDGLVLELASNEGEAAEYFDEMARLHQEHWTALGKKGCFASERFTEFHRTLCRKFVRSGFAVLARLRGSSGTLVVIQGYVVGDKFHAYQSGRVDDRRGRVASPSTAMHLLLMARLLERGITKYDFLAGNTYYKDRISNDHQLYHNLRVVNSTWRIKARTVYGGLKRRAMRLISGETPSRGAVTQGPMTPVETDQELVKS